MTVFAEKLDGLPQTIRTAGDGTNVPVLGEAIRTGLQRIVFAVGSGGSAIAAQYLALSRQTLQAAPTMVQTPLQFTLDEQSLVETDVWLFSARGSNPDILAALDAAIARNARRIHLVTTSASSPLAERLAALPEGSIHITPTDGTRDGFLATHSMAAAVTALLLAADHSGPSPRTGELFAEWIAATEARLGHGPRAAMAQRLSSICRSDALFVLQDPRLDAPALLIETCAWEAGLCPVQRTDFRNFAHGRHVWLAHRGAETFVLALTGRETRLAWRDIEAALPGVVRREVLEGGSCGRFEAATVLLDALVVVEALGLAVGIDPGRPGTGDFAEALYEAPSLQTTSANLSAPIRSKSAAIRQRDHPSGRDVDLQVAAKTFLAGLADAAIHGLVLDYDGTLVTFEGRERPMSSELAIELTRLLDEGLAVGIATGRGGSGGQALREALPNRHWDQVVVSYYNGAYTQPLRTDIDELRPPADPRLDPAREWLGRSDAFRDAPSFRDSHVQLTIEISSLSDADLLSRRFNEEANPDGRLRLSRSSHTVDICLADACKTTVAARLAERTGASLDSILCIGDSGAISGNDHALLGLPRGVSVGRVCDRPHTAWSLFGERIQGPDAVLKILRALGPVNGTHHLRVDELVRLDRTS